MSMEFNVENLLKCAESCEDANISEGDIREVTDNLAYNARFMDLEDIEKELYAFMNRKKKNYFRFQMELNNSMEKEIGFEKWSKVLKMGVERSVGDCM